MSAGSSVGLSAGGLDFPPGLIGGESKPHVYTVEFYMSVKKKEFFLFATVWMDLEIIRLCHISQSKKNKYHMISLICGI